MLLDGVRVLDLTRLLPGGYCTQLLQAQGAQVTKVEPPAGDPIRALPGGNAYFEALHSGKQPLTLDLRTETGRDALRRRVLDTDVLVEGFRPGVMERMEIGYAALAAINPGLVYCAITGYGSSGQMAGRAGHDLNYLARSGALSLMPLREGVPTIPGLQVADLAGGLHAAFLIAGALVAQARSGRGSRVEVSMTDEAAELYAPPILTGAAACYRVYETADGRGLTVAALEPRFWRRFCELVGLPDLDGYAPALPELEARLRERPLDAWLELFDGEEVCAGPVAQRAAVTGEAPALGEHTAAWTAELTR